MGREWEELSPCDCSLAKSCAGERGGQDHGMSLNLFRVQWEEFSVGEPSDLIYGLYTSLWAF